MLTFLFTLAIFSTLIIFGMKMSLHLFRLEIPSIKPFRLPSHFKPGAASKEAADEDEASTQSGMQYEGTTPIARMGFLLAILLFVVSAVLFSLISSFLS